jgi:AcrR family transcriptional regulator
VVGRPQSDTRQRIQEVARELFAAKGVQRTSLQDIADRLGLTKPALYYHFASREELVRSIVAPLIEEGEAFLATEQRRDVVDPRALLEGYFDLHYEHRGDLQIIVAELPTLVELGFVERVIAWRESLGKLIFGPRPTLAQAARATIAFGGLQDCCVQFPDASKHALRTAAVAGALDALGLPSQD